MQIIINNEDDLSSIINNMKNRRDETEKDLRSSVELILRDVRENGDRAVRKYEIKYGGICADPFSVSYEEMKNAFNNSDEAFKVALVRAADNIREYHEKQIEKSYEIEKKDGSLVGQVIRGLARVGIYVPGGTAAYPSTVLMNTIPAKLAKVGEIIMLSPPEIIKKSDGSLFCRANPDILTAAYIAGVDRVFLAGGAQAVGAMAYGTESIPPVDKIVGPGNIYVATAKRIVYGHVDIDMTAGPSEILIISDGSAEPRFAAADLLSQAEHDPMAAAVLVTTDEDFAKKVLEQLDEQLEKLNRKEIIRESLNNYGLIVVCGSADEMIDIANEIAPEHLEIMTSDPMTIFAGIKNAGSVFLGPYSPEPLGDYYSGTNHVLPTMGTARFASPLGVYNFTKKMSYTYYTKEALGFCAGDILEIAGREGLEAHARSVSARFCEKDGIE
ncbi:MAG TPA: histidinol dehydrogenase [Bacillota bacterium]|nr:histidinol dehydrogenase [Bacillota bacterium]